MSTAPQNATSADAAQKHRAILEEAIDVFAAEGFRNADVQVIADKAGVGKGTVYRYFGNKQDLFWATTYEVLDRLGRHLIGAVEEVSGARNRLRAAGLAYAGFFQGNPRYLEVFVQDRAEFRGCGPESHVEYHQELITRFESVVQQGIDRGEFRPLDVRKTVIALGNLLYGTVVNACFSSIGYSMTEMVEHAIDIYLDGFGTALPEVTSATPTLTDGAEENKT